MPALIEGKILNPMGRANIPKSGDVDKKPGGSNSLKLYEARTPRPKNTSKAGKYSFEIYSLPTNKFNASTFTLNFVKYGLGLLLSMAIKLLGSITFLYINSVLKYPLPGFFSENFLKKFL